MNSFRKAMTLSLGAFFAVALFPVHARAQQPYIGGSPFVSVNTFPSMSVYTGPVYYFGAQGLSPYQGPTQSSFYPNAYRTSNWPQWNQPALGPSLYAPGAAFTPGTTSAFYPRSYYGY